MIGLDTNVLVRYLVGDDPLQFRKVSALIEQDQRFMINMIVLCELVWVLHYSYQYSKPEIAGVLDKLLVTRQFEIENKEVVRMAVEEYKINKADFSDCLIGHWNRQAGCDKTVSLDKGVKSLKTFDVLQ